MMMILDMDDEEAPSSHRGASVRRVAVVAKKDCVAAHYEPSVQIEDPSGHSFIIFPICVSGSIVFIY